MATPPYDFKEDDEIDYSPTSTLIHFDHPIPLLRGPIPSSSIDDPELGPYVLAFPSQKSFFSALESTKSKLLEQCEAGVRIGCSIVASDKCRPPWWKTLFGGPTKSDFRERNECEEREMRVCLDGSKEKCVNFVREKCVGPFGSARIAFRERKLREKEVGRLISWICGFGFSNGSKLVSDNQLLNLSFEVTNIRGKEIFGFENYLN